MKKLILMIVFMLVASLVVLADTQHDDFSAAQSIIQQKIPYDQLTDDQFELLGDYFMELMAGENHEYMDQMMGGDGSESLRQTHINMGRNFYAQYLQEGIITPTYGMMRGPTMIGTSFQNDGFGHMMYPGTGHVFWGFGVFGFFGMIIFWGFIIWLIYWIIQQTTSRQKNAEKPIDLLKKRLAKGEITKKEYDELKQKLMR